MGMTTPGFNLDIPEWADSTGIFEFCPEMLAIIADDGGFVRISAASAQTIGVACGDLTGTSLYDLVHPDDVHLAAKKFEAAVRAEERVSFKCRCRASDGRYRWIEWSLLRPPSSAQIYAVARDVTDHSTAEQELARANEIL